MVKNPMGTSVELKLIVAVGIVPASIHEAGTSWMMASFSIVI